MGVSLHKHSLCQEEPKLINLSSFVSETHCSYSTHLSFLTERATPTKLDQAGVISNSTLQQKDNRRKGGMYIYNMHYSLGRICLIIKLSISKPAKNSYTFKLSRHCAPGRHCVLLECGLVQRRLVTLITECRVNYHAS